MDWVLGCCCACGIEPSGGGRLGPKSSSSESESESELSLSLLLEVGGGSDGPMTLRRLSAVFSVSLLVASGAAEGSSFRFDELSMV